MGAAVRGVRVSLLGELRALYARPTSRIYVRKGRTESTGCRGDLPDPRARETLKLIKHSRARWWSRPVTTRGSSLASAHRKGCELIETNTARRPAVPHRRGCRRVHAEDRP